MPITLKTFSSPIDAHFLKSKLENEGIWCALLNENVNAIYPLSNVSISGIDLVIHKEDQKRALTILEQNAHHIVDHKTNKAICPHCNSSRIVSRKVINAQKGLLNQLKMLFLDLFQFNSTETYSCKDCLRNF